MNAAHLHMIINHLPIAGMLCAIPILLIAWWKQSELLGRTGLFVVLITGLIAIPVFLSGEPAEEVIEHLPGISEKLIKAHEEAAEKTIWAIGFTALTALLGLIINFQKKYLPKWAVPTVTLLAVASMAILAWTNNLGGQIRHPEIRPDNVSTPAGSGDQRNAETNASD